MSVDQSQALVRQEEAAAIQRQMSFKEIEEWGGVFFKSGMFDDLKNASAAMVKVKAGQELGIEPFAAINGIHIIKGKTSVGAKLQASIVNRSQRFYYECKELSKERCVLEFFGRSIVTGQWRSLGVSEFSMQDAMSAGLADRDNTQNGRGQNGAMYKKYAKNMLFARAMTNGVSWFCPEVLNGNSGAVGVVNDFDAEEVVRDNGQPEAIIPDVQPVEPDRYEPDGTPAQPTVPLTPEGTAAKSSVDDTDNSGAIDAEPWDAVELSPIEQKRKHAMEIGLTKFGGDLEEFDKFLRGRQIAMLAESALDTLVGQLEAL